MMKRSDKLEKNIDLKRGLKYLSTLKKIIQIRSISMEKSNREVRERKLFMKREKMKKFIKST